MNETTKCPVTGAARQHTHRRGTTNRDWWPTQVNLDVLHQHHHLVCLDCGRIIDIEDPRLNRLPRPKVSPDEFLIQDYQVHFRGRCSTCCQKASALLSGPRSAPSPRITKAKPYPK